MSGHDVLAVLPQIYVSLPLVSNGRPPSPQQSDVDTKECEIGTRILGFTHTKEKFPM